MKRTLLILLPILSGCAPYAQVQIDLLRQTRRGVEFVRNDLTEKSRMIQSYQASQRKRIDEAFDADVMARSSLSADWVIEHRRAYAAAVDALHAACTASYAADRSSEQNLDAIDEALQRIILMQETQIRLATLIKEYQP